MEKLQVRFAVPNQPLVGVDNKNHSEEQGEEDENHVDECDGVAWLDEDSTGDAPIGRPCVQDQDPGIGQEGQGTADSWDGVRGTQVMTGTPGLNHELAPMISPVTDVVSFFD